MGKPVFKRAKHGIHFQNNDGSITANFSGKPCHYLDGSIWRPIDTTLIKLSDGWYSSPHSDVRIHPDGRVKVKNSTYQQFTELPSAKTGVLSGDRIIRTFPGGEQHLIMKENGFREEIHVFKPTFPLEKFIAKTTGNLPTKYNAHPITAEDANDDTYTFTGDVVAFGAWLDGAKYPVVIDPDISVNTGVGGDVSGAADATYNYGARTSLNLSANLFCLIRFDLSSILSSSLCTATTLKLTSAYNTVSNTYNVYKVSDANGDWIEGTQSGALALSGEPCYNAKEADGAGGVTTAWAGSAGLQTAGTDYVNTVLATVTGDYDAGDAYELPFNAPGLAVVQGWFGDATNNGFLIKAGNNNTTRAASGEHATEGYRPVLTVTYTAGGNSRYYYSQMQ